ncbi:MAG: DUF4350 domain-containing protein, partial [Leeuwenhoekiella sp.]
RSTYTISTGQLNEDFIGKVSAKSGSERTEVKQLIDAIITIRQQPVITEQQLIELNTRVENFKVKN